jgi:hypothetical protein
VHSHAAEITFAFRNTRSVGRYLISCGTCRRYQGTERLSEVVPRQHDDLDKGSPLFETLGGMHNVYVNSVGEAALKKGGPFPNKTVFATDLHEFTVSDGSYVEGARKALAVMVKDSKKHASTGGWGFQLWEGGDPKKPKVTDAAKQCFECHQPKKDQDYVYSTYIP